MAYSQVQRAVLREFGQRVRSARDLRGWTQEILAAEASLDRTYVGGIERGERNPGLLNVNKLAMALGESFAGFLPCRAGPERN
jgi:transcriptional regulator with XRE-family HTH domain